MAEAIGFQKDTEGYYIYKDPSATKDYAIDFSEWLVDGDTLDNVTWTVPLGITKEVDGITPDGLRAWIKLSGGSEDANYEIIAHIVTANGLIDDYTFRVVIGQQ